MSFFGVTLKPNDPFIQIINQFVCLRLTNAVVPPSSPEKKGSLYFYREKEKIPLCHFDDQNCQFHDLNLLFHPHEQMNVGVDGNIHVCISGSYFDYNKPYDDNDAGFDVDEDMFLGDDELEAENLDIPLPSSNANADVGEKEKNKKGKENEIRKEKEKEKEKVKEKEKD